MALYHSLNQIMASTNNRPQIIVRGAGEMASGVLHRLFQSGYKVISLELDQPLAVRRMVCFSEAVYESSWTVEGVTAVKAGSVSGLEKILSNKQIPILIDSEGSYLNYESHLPVVDARMLKQDVTYDLKKKQTIIGLGPGFRVGHNCHSVIETNRGANLGAILYSGSAETDTGRPAEVNGVGIKRVVRANRDGRFVSQVIIGEAIRRGDLVGRINERPVLALIDGMVRGLIRDNSDVISGQKIGDIDPRQEKESCYRISDKAQAIGKAVLSAIRTISDK